MSNHQGSNKENLGIRDGTRRNKRRSILANLNLDLAKDIQNKRKKKNKKVSQKKRRNSLRSRKVSKTTTKKTTTKKTTTKKSSKTTTKKTTTKKSTTKKSSKTDALQIYANNGNKVNATTAIPDLDLYSCQTMRDQEDEDFNEKFLAEINRVLNYRMKTKKFQYTKRISEQSKLMRDIKTVITSFQQRTAHFTESCLTLEEQLISEKKQCKNDLILAKKEEELVQMELKKNRNELLQHQKHLKALQVDKEKLQITREHSDQQLKQLTMKNQELEPKITTMIATREKLERKLVLGNSKFEKIKEQLANKTNQCAKVQMEHKKEVLSQQKEFNDKVNVEQEKLNNIKAEMELLLKEKKTVEIKLQETQIQTAVLKSQHSRSLGKSESLQKESDRLQQEITDLKQKIETKNTELAAVVSSFNRTQSFNEKRTNTLSGEKKIMEEKLRCLEIEKVNTEEKNQALKNELATTKDSLKRCIEQHDKTLVQLEESNQELERLQINFSESIEKQKKEHQQIGACWEKEKENVCKTMLEKEDSLKSINERTAKFASELKTFKEKCNVTDNKQLEEFCRLAMEANYLRNQLTGNKNVAKTLADLQAENKELNKKMSDSEMMCNKLNARLQKLKEKRKN